MNNLSPVTKVLAIFALLIVCFFLIVQCIRSKPKPKGTEVTKTEPASVKPSSQESITIPTPQLPKNGVRRGVVEMGAKGFNFFIIEIDKSKNWKLINSGFGSSLVYERMATEASILLALKEYISTMINFVDGKNIHFIVGSGARRDDRSLKIEEALKRLGYVVNIVTPEEEAIYAYKSAMPNEYMYKGFVVDIGSGNSKIAWLDIDETVHAASTYGAKYYQDSVSEHAVRYDVSNQTKKVPEARTSVCFIIGGVPFEMADQHRKDKERYTVLKAPSEYSVPGDLRFAAGKNIYQSIREQSGCETFVFDWDANFSIGFLLDL